MTASNHNRRFGAGVVAVGGAGADGVDVGVFGEGGVAIGGVFAGGVEADLVAVGGVSSGRARVGSVGVGSICIVTMFLVSVIVPAVFASIQCSWCQ